jgi:malate synthase
MNSRHDSVVYSREPRGPGVELGSPKESGGGVRDATFGAALTPLALRLLASLHRRFDVRRLELAALREAPPGCGAPDDLTRNAPALSIRGEPVWAGLFGFVLSVCEAPRPNRGRFVATVAEPTCDCERRLWIDVFAAAEEALGLRSGTVCFVTFNDSRFTANESTPESIK